MKLDRFWSWISPSRALDESGARSLSSEEAFWAALDAAVPRWRKQRGHPCVFAGFRRTGAAEEDERIEEVVTSTLGATLDPPQPVRDALYRRLDRVAARAAVESLLRFDLAMDSEWVNVQEAQRVADAFVACFSPRASFRTNGDVLVRKGYVSHGWEPSERSGWTPLTAATFDTGIVGVDEAMAGILWVTDED